MGSGELSNQLTSSSLKKAQSTGLDCILFTEQQQQGDTFGERFTHAMTAVFSMGYDNIITIGNDTPQLRPQHIKEAHHRLQQQQITIGPSIDGGFYLLALSKQQFNAKVFEAFDWQTHKVFRQVYQCLKPSQLTSLTPRSIHCLSAYYDLDQYTTIKKILALWGVRHTNIAACLQALITAANTTFQYLQIGLATEITSQYYNKGSPVIAL